MTRKVIFEAYVDDDLSTDDLLFNVRHLCTSARVVGWREPLALFADAMEAKLAKNDHKSGWREQPVEALFRLFMLEVEEFKVADEFFTVAEARGELVDISNYALILHDRLGMIDATRNRRAQESTK